VTFNVPAGGAAFDVQDLMIVSINCVRVTGAGNGFYGRQDVIIDLANINCGAINQCFEAEQNARIKAVGFVVISGSTNCFACTSDMSLISFPFTNITVNTNVSIPYFVNSHKLSRVEFLGAAIFNPELVAAGSRCMAFRGGLIEKNGLTLPCADVPISDGKIYP
jgi:hypothetical protein